MARLIIFDLDGVLLDAKKIHFASLNTAIAEVTKSTHLQISWQEHLNKYDGLKTHSKLNILVDEKGLSGDLKNIIWEKKQYQTKLALSKLQNDFSLINTMKELKSLGYTLACCSNSIRGTVYTSLSKLGILEYFDLALSNEDVKNSKPHPEMYWKAMSTLGFLPDETLIVEDSPVGILAAQRSGASVMRVKSPQEVEPHNILRKIGNNDMRTKARWSDDNLNVLIPMAGAGSRFAEAGYVFPKPLIEVNGKPMIQVVVENIGIDANYIFIVQASHRKDYNLDHLLSMISPNCTIIEVDKMTEGAACTALLAKEHINNSAPLFFANSDQFVEWDSCEFMYKMQETDADGGIVTFNSVHPKWSFAKVDDSGFVTEVAEKRPISNLATVGYYFWKNGSDFVKHAEQMIENDVRVNNEFYVCPVFNEAISAGKKIRTFNAEKMWGLGTPHDLNHFLSNYGKKP